MQFSLWWIGVAVAVALYNVLTYILLIPKKLSLNGKHVFITGGSLGIGKSMAIEFVKRGSNVTIVARNEASLKEALDDLNRARVRSDQRLAYAVADVAKYESMQAAVARATLTAGPIDIVVANAGLSIPGYFVEQGAGEFIKQAEVNYLGTAFTVKAALPDMIRRRSGHIVIVSSPVSMAGFVGFGSYAPTKFAQRGLAEVLANELIGFNIGVSVVYPSDTATPGFEAENRTKPPETKLLSDVGALQSPEAVARTAVQGVVERRFHVPTDLISWVSTVANNGLVPRRWPVLESLAQPLLQLVQCCMVAYFNHVARGVAKKQLKLA